MSENYPKRIVNILKRINGGIFAINADNALYGMKSPKILLTITQPGKDETGKYVQSKFFADEKEVMFLIRRAYTVRQAGEIFKSYKGGMDPKREKVVARVFTVKFTDKGYILSIENCEGEQKYTKDKYGNKVNGIVSVKSGGETFARNSILLSVEEFFYFVDSLKMELQAWRNTINTDMFYHPDKYRFKNSNQIPSELPPPTEEAI